MSVQIQDQPWRAQPNPRLVPPELEQAVRRSAVYWYLLIECLRLRVGTQRDLERAGIDFDRLAVTSPPSYEFNVIGSSECARKFGDLADIDGFYRCSNGSWWLDVDERLSTRGLIAPVRDSRRPSLVNDLKVWRHVRDPHPFLLRVRAERKTA